MSSKFQILIILHLLDIYYNYITIDKIQVNINILPLLTKITDRLDIILNKRCHRILFLLKKEQQNIDMKYHKDPQNRY